jgi:hypothetical protein
VALGRPQPVAHALIVSAPDHTVYDPQCGVRSVQAADLILPTDALDAIWDPTHLERLARTYWRWLSRATGGVVQVDYQEHGRQVKALGLIPLLTFKEPEYEMSADRGIVRWRIERGVLVAKAGRGGAGYLEIDVKRQESKDYPGSSICHVEVEVANFYPAIASTISRWLYENTQSRIHVLVTHGFLRGLARLDLAESKASASPTSPTCRTPSGARATYPRRSVPISCLSLDRSCRAEIGGPCRPRAHDERLGGG